MLSSLSWIGNILVVKLLVCSMTWNESTLAYQFLFLVYGQSYDSVLVFSKSAKFSL